MDIFFTKFEVDLMGNMLTTKSKKTERSENDVHVFQKKIHGRNQISKIPIKNHNCAIEFSLSAVYFLSV